MKRNSARRHLTQEAKAIVALSFRNGPIENIHAGRRCPACDGQSGISRITDAEMKTIMKAAVDSVYELLSLKIEDPKEYDRRIKFGSLYTATWDEPEEFSPVGVAPVSHRRLTDRNEQNDGLN